MLAAAPLLAVCLLAAPAAEVPAPPPAAPASAPAAKPEAPAVARPRAKKPRIVVVGFQPVGLATPEEQKRGDLLTEVATTDVSSFGLFEVVSRSDVRAMLEFDKQKQLLGCGESESCIAEIGGALGAQYLLVGSIGTLDKLVRLDLKLVEVARARVLGRGGQAVTPQDAVLITTVKKLVREAMAPLLPDELRRAPVPGIATNEGFGRRDAAWLVGGTGAALLVGGAVVGALAYSSYLDLEEASKGGDVDGYDRARSALKGRSLAADVLFGVGAAAAVSGAALYFTSDTVTVALAPTSNGFLVALSEVPR